MTVGGVEAEFVTVTVPLEFVTTRIGAMTLPVAEVRVVVEAAVIALALLDRRRLPSGGFAARVGLGVATDVSVGVRTVVFALVIGVAVDAAVVGVTVDAASVGVVMIAAVVGVAVVVANVGVVAIAAVVGVAVAPVVAASGAAVPVVAPTVDAAVAPVVAEPRTITPPPPAPPLVTTGIGSELMDAFTVACGFAYADGGTS
jgi:hypothetical protein